MRSPSFGEIYCNIDNISTTTTTTTNHKPNIFFSLCFLKQKRRLNKNVHYVWSIICYKFVVCCFFLYNFSLSISITFLSNFFYTYFNFSLRRGPLLFVCFDASSNDVWIELYLNYSICNSNIDISDWECFFHPIFLVPCMDFHNRIESVCAKSLYAARATLITRPRLSNNGIKITRHIDEENQWNSAIYRIMMIK